MADAWPLYVIMTVGVFNIWLGLLLGFQLLNDSIRSRDAIITGVLASFINHGTRQLGVIFGVHSLVTIIAVIFICAFITRKAFWETAAAAAIAFVTIGSLEAAEINIALEIVPNCIAFIAAHPWVNILAMIPNSALMMIMFSACKKHKLVLFDSVYFEIK